MRAPASPSSTGSTPNGSDTAIERDGDGDRVTREVGDGLERSLNRLWRFALMRCGDQSQADDLVQATCVRALERARQFRSGTRIESWLFAILESIWRNTARAQGVRRGNGIIDIADAHLQSGEADEDVRVEYADTMRQIAALPPGQRTVLLLVCVEGFSYRETADVLDLPIGTVMSRLAAARDKLKRASDTEG